MKRWKTIETAIWANVPVAGAVLVLAGLVSRDPVATGLGLLVALGGAWKAASTL